MHWKDIVERQTGILNFTDDLNHCIGKTKIAVFGSGGNGAVMDFLLRTGYQHFMTIDFDVVEASNLNRLPFTPDYIGMRKVDAWEKYLKTVNPECHVETYNKTLDRNDEDFVADIVKDYHIVLLNTSDYEANIVIARVASQLGKRMIAGPGTSNCYVVTTFTHENGVTLESVGGFGTENTALADIDYEEIRPKFMQLYMFPGRRERLDPGTLLQVQNGVIAPRSSKLFVSLVNCAQTWETVKNTAILNGLELQNTEITEFPVMQMFDPFRGSSFYWNSRTREVGVPNWLTDEIAWSPYREDG